MLSENVTDIERRMSSLIQCLGVKPEMDMVGSIHGLGWVGFGSMTRCWVGYNDCVLLIIFGKSEMEDFAHHEH